MLQPRLFGCCDKMSSALPYVVVFAIFLTPLVSCQELTNEAIEVTRIKRDNVPENRDLTVLLVNDKQRQDSKVGRYHSVKPLIGLLTSTARTFIQDGVTTEFATQILGTTLDNGRIYAQLLTKTSLVLYSKPNNDDVTVQSTRVPSIFDEQWNVKEDLGFIDPEKFVVKNTDYLAPSKMNVVFASKPAFDNVKHWNPPVNQIDNNIPEEPIARKAPLSNEIPKYVKFDLNKVDNPGLNKKFIVSPATSDNINAVYRQSKSFESISEPVVDSSANEDSVNELNVVKVKNTYDVPTFTIKNEFSPIFYYIDNVEAPREQNPPEQTKLPKQLFGQNREPTPKKTFTYVGFADFTTVVGDTVIIFSPNTETVREPNPSEINVFSPGRRPEPIATKVTFLSADIPVATSTFNAYDVNTVTKSETSVVEDNSKKPVYKHEEDLNDSIYNVNDKTHPIISVQQSSGYDFNLDVIQPSEPAMSTTESTHYTDELDVVPIHDYMPQATEPLSDFNPSSTVSESSKETDVTENSTYEIYTKSEEDTSPKIGQLTTPTVPTTQEIEDNDHKFTEITTESIAIIENESNDKFHEHDDVPETTTETKYDVHEEIICTNGLQTRSTMTTEYKTLTYLTSYFIPLDDSTETSTSIKSDVVVESHVGYTTNFVCKTDLNIEPTDVISIDIQSSIHSSLEPPESVLEPISHIPPTIGSPNPEVTKNLLDISSTEKSSTIKEEEIEIGKHVTSPEVQESTEGTTTISTTTERVTTTNSHTEVSVSTEHSSPPTENPIEKEKEDESQENEIDVIYKTLYTTYTYFTTFFGDQTSSVASHKAIETNVITSTIDLSNLDPSLLGALSNQEIAPTSVGIGRPTAAIAQSSISNLFENKFLIESVEQQEAYHSQTPTPALGEDMASIINPDSVKTYFTTYTFFTTIYVGDDANICSRSEVYTNYVGPDELIPTKINPLANLNTRAQYDFRNCKQLKLDNPEYGEIDGSPSRAVEVDMLFSADSNPLISENAYVTDVTSSSSKGERKVIDNNNILEDQISSESNIEEILPSPTLLLQTSYTTFTYFTTMYIGKDSSNVKSRLETVTNVVTETITPNKEVVEENTLPITYYTTFTYWTTLSKDNSTTITSREDIVSNIVTPGVPIAPTAGIIDTTPIDNDNLVPPLVLPASPIDTTPIEVVNIPKKDLDLELKPSLLTDDSEHDDGKATFYTTYTYFTTFYVGNTSQIRSSLETVTSIVDNTKALDDNQLGRKVQTGPFDQNLVQVNDKKLKISPSIVKEQIIATKIPDVGAVAPTVLLGTYIDNLFAEVKPVVTANHDIQRKIISSQVAVISGESSIVTNDNKSLIVDTTTELSTTTSTTTENPVITPNPEVIESSVAESETTTESIKEEDDGTNSRKKSRLTYPSKISPFTPLIRPFVSKYRPTFSPKRVPPAGIGATTITRADTTPTITATPTLKSVRPSLAGSNKKQLQSASSGPTRSGNRFGGARSSASTLASNIPSASKAGFGNRASSIQPSGRRTGFRTSSVKNNNLDFASRSAAVPKIRPTPSSRLRNNKQTASVTGPPSDQSESETFATQQEESVTETLDDVTEVPGRTTTVNPLLKFRRPAIARQPGTVIPNRTTPPTVRKNTTVRGRLTTTTRKTTTTRSSNPLLALRRDRPNSLFPKRNLLKQPEPTPEEEKLENEQEGGEENEEILEEEEFNDDTDYDSSNRKERQVSTPATPLIRRNVSPVQIRPFRRRAKRQVDYGSRKYTNFRRPGTVNLRKNDPDPEPEIEKPTPSPAPTTSNKSKVRTSSRSNSRPSTNTKTTTAPSTKSPSTKSAARQPFIVRGESRTTTTTSSPAYRRKSNSNSRNSPSRSTTTVSSRPKSPRLSNGKSSLSRPSTSRSTNSRTSRTRTTTSRSNGRLRGSFENTSGERLNNYNHLVNDGKLTVTHHIPVEVTVPIVNGRITEYKNLLTASASLETLFENQVSTTIGALGKPQLLLASDLTELADNGATKLIKYLIHETPTTTIIFTPTTIRGRKTSYSHVLPSTVYNVEAVTSTITPEINANLPLANLLLSQLLLGNQQPGLNPLLALQGNPLIPQQPIVQTPVTEIKTKTTTYVTTVTDARETVLPITFRGRAILTTIIDPTINVITATEFLTETVVTTPTVFGPGPSPQLNSLLLPFLLQQQQQQQPQLPLQTPNPLLGLGHPELNFDHLNNDIASKPNVLTDFNSNEDLADAEASEEVYEDAPTPPPPTTTTTSSPRHLTRGKSQRTTKANKIPHAMPGASSPMPPHAPQAPLLPAQPAASKITSIVTLYVSGRHPAFDTNAIVYDNSPWRPGRDTNVVERAITDEEDERKFKNLATRIMSNGVEVLVKDKNSDGKNEQRKVKLIHLTSLNAPKHHVSSTPTKSLLSSAVATVVKRQQLSALFPLQNLMQHNYIIKTCMTTYTYLTTVIQNKRSAISTFETIVSVVTTESLTNAYASDLLADIKPTKTKYMEVKTIQPSTPGNMFHSNAPKIDKRVDIEGQIDNFDLIQPSEVSQTPCSGSCPCTNIKTEDLSAKYTNNPSAQFKYEETKIIRPTNIQLDKKTNYGPYKFENNSNSAPTDKVVEKYTEVMNDYSDEKDSSSVESELLTNEKAPFSTNLNKTNNKTDKNKTEKPQKQNKNKLVVAELIKLGNLGIKSLSQLAPVIEKMTGSFIRRQDVNKTTTTVKPATKLTSYNMNKRVDTDIESKHSNFPIYIPMNELETAESNIVLPNATLHQNLAWAAEHKQPKSHIVPHKIVHESPLVNGGIPISPGEIITANSDVIVGKPAVGGPLTLAASGIKTRNPINSPPIDSFSSGSELYAAKELPSRSEHTLLATKLDDSYDLRPPELPKLPTKSNKNLSRPSMSTYNHNSIPTKRIPVRPRPQLQTFNDETMKIESIKNVDTVIVNHGRPAFLDYIPSLSNPTTLTPINSNSHYNYKDNHHIDLVDNSPSSSEIISTQVTKDSKFVNYNEAETMNKPFLVDIQPSKVANVLIPHGSSTALVFAGSSEPHKTGDYVDDPLPYPEPGYFGSFSIDAPQMTNVHITSENKKYSSSSAVISDETVALKDQPIKKDFILKWKDSQRPIDFGNLPPPTSNQETHFLVGPQITVYNPDLYRPENGDVIKSYNQDKQKDVIDKEYENYLSVPPPPRTHHSQENSYDNNKPYNQKPIVHTKPIQDMKVFLNVQHPLPKDQLPPKITSEIYFASQAANDKSTPTYTIRMPSSPSAHESIFMKPQGPNKQTYASHAINKHDSFILTSNIAAKKPVAAKNVNNNSYSVLLNTANNNANNIRVADSVIGSSIPISIGSSNFHELNTDIPISTNFAIKVEDGSSVYDTKEDKNGETPSNFDKDRDFSFGNRVTDNQWNTTTIIKGVPNVLNKNTYTNNVKDNLSVLDATEKNFISPSLNSHANFPMINEQISSAHNTEESLKPVTEVILDEIKFTDPKRPAKVIVNIPTNSHGWYSNVPFDKINNIKVDATTSKIIPLIHDYNTGNIPDFGQKVTSVGKPPTNFWPQNIPPVLTTIGKPFTKSKYDKEYSNAPKISTQSHEPSYTRVPSSLGGVKQPVYDIPVRDNSDETTTIKIMRTTLGKIKPVYENSEEVYDGNDDNVNDELEGAVSLESMKVQFVSTSNEKDSPMSNKAITTQHKTVNPPKGFSKNKSTQIKSEDFDYGTQTEKPFGSYNKSTFQSNSIKPIYNNVTYSKPRPFNLMPLDHQLQQPHWQINQLLGNSTNASYEDGLDLNIGEEIKTTSTAKTQPTNKTISHFIEDNRYKKPQRPIFSVNPTKNQVNDTNIITSTVHIQDKKPLIVEVTEKATLPTFTINNFDFNSTSSDIVDLSPPPPTEDYNFKPSTDNEMIMGMSPPPPVMRPHLPLRATTIRPGLSVRTPSLYKTKPPRTLAPRIPTHRPSRKPSREDVSTYRPTFDLNNIKRPVYNRDQPSSHLLPPPKELPTKVIGSKTEISPTVNSIYLATNIVFPTPISSGWLTSSGVDFQSSSNFDKTSVYFPEITKSSILPDSSAENSYSYEDEMAPEYSEQVSSEKSTNVEEKTSIPKEIFSSTESPARQPFYEETDFHDSVPNESSQETIETTDKSTFISLVNKNRTRKPYPIRNDDKNIISKHKVPEKPTNVIRPTRTLTRPEILYPTRHIMSTRKNIRPILSTSTNVNPPSIIESSELSIDDNLINPTKLVGDTLASSIIAPTTYTEKAPGSKATPSLDEKITSVIATHHAGNEIKISDEVIPTKTEFRTTIVTLTKTLSEPPTTVSSIGYLNLTHTLTVTHTMTSLISQSEGAITQTLILTNTQTSTIVDVVTEIQTQVQPTTIIETVTKHIPIPQFEATPVQKLPTQTRIALDDVTISSEESDNFIIKESETTENIQKIENENITENDNDTFFVVMNKSQSGGQSPPVKTDIETAEYDITRNEQVSSNGVSQVLYGEILLAGAPYLETFHPTGTTFGKECQPDCKASRNERCQRIEGLMKCVCRPGFARTFPDRPCKPTYTYSVKLALSSQGNKKLQFQKSLADNSSKEYHALAQAAHEGINRMVMQSDLRDVYHGVHITGFHPVEMESENGENYQGVMNDFYVQLSDNAHESRLKEVIEKYLRTNNYSLGGTNVHAAGELMDKLDVSDFDECLNGQFHDCSEHAQCFNLRGTYTCSCLEGFGDLSVNTLYPGRICSAEPVGCERCNYHGACYSRDDKRVLCECFQWYTGSTCHINLKVVLISLVVIGALLSLVLAACAVVACSRKTRTPAPPRSIVACIQGMPGLPQGAMPSKQRADRRALINERPESGDASSLQNASLPYMPAKRPSSSSVKKCIMSDPPTHEAPPPPPSVMIPRARLHQHHESRENIARKRSLELSNEEKLISYLESGAIKVSDEMRRKHSMESSYSANIDRHTKQGALVSAGYKVSTTIRPDEKEERDDLSSVHKADLEAELSGFDSLRKSYSQEELSEWTDAERRLGEHTLSEARSVGGTLPASTGRAASSTRLTHQDANTMAERDLGSTFLLPHVHLYKPDITSDVSEFDSL